MGWRSRPLQARHSCINRNGGIITKVDLTTTPPTFTDIFTGGTRGDFTAVGPDGCLYATQSDRVIKLTNADGSCSLAPTSVFPKLRVTMLGSGSGGVTSSPTGIDCGPICSALFSQ